jgi:hypothetical protein
VTFTDLIVTMLGMVAMYLITRGFVVAWLEYRDRKRWEALQTKRPYIRRN